MHLNDDASRNEVADNRYHKQYGIPDFAIGLVFFKLTYQQQARQEAYRETTDRKAEPRNRLGKLEPQRTEQHKYDELQKIRAVGLEYLFAARPGNRGGTVTGVGAGVFLFCFCHCYQYNKMFSKLKRVASPTRLRHTKSTHNLGGTMATKKKQPAKKQEHYRSFVKARGPKPFVTFRLTQQTVYWIVISFLVLALGTWAMYLTVRVQNIYNQIDANQTTDVDMSPRR